MRPAVHHCDAAWLQRAVDFLCAVEAGAGGEEDGDVGEGVRECVVGEAQVFAFLVVDGDGPVVLCSGVGEGGDKGRVDVSCVDLGVVGCGGGGEDEAGYGS